MAIELVREHPFVEGAKLIATSTEFLVLSKNFAKACDFATRYAQVEASLPPRTVRQIRVSPAHAHKDHTDAAKCFLKADMLNGAPVQLDRCGCREDLDDIVSVIHKCNDDDNIVNLVLDNIEAVSERGQKQAVEADAVPDVPGRSRSVAVCVAALALRTQ